MRSNQIEFIPECKDATNIQAKKSIGASTHSHFAVLILQLLSIQPIERCDSMKYISEKIFLIKTSLR